MGRLRNKSIPEKGCDVGLPSEMAESGKIRFCLRHSMLLEVWQFR
jgi:hypothetical protein